MGSPDAAVRTALDIVAIRAVVFSAGFGDLSREDTIILVVGLIRDSIELRSPCFDCSRHQIPEFFRAPQRSASADLGDVASTLPDQPCGRAEHSSARRMRRIGLSASMIGTWGGVSAKDSALDRSECCWLQPLPGTTINSEDSTVCSRRPPLGATGIGSFLKTPWLSDGELAARGGGHVGSASDVDASSPAVAFGGEKWVCSKSKDTRAALF